jgi:hypothetical protein
MNQVSRHENVWESGGIVPLFLTSELDAGELSDSRPGCFAFLERTSLDKRTGCLGGPQSRSGRCGEEKNRFHMPGIEPRLSSPYPVAIPTELSRITEKQKLLSPQGRAIDQAVSCRLPTSATRVRARVSSCGICGEQSGNGVGFLPVLRFPLPIFIPSTTPHSSSIIRGWYNRPIIGRRTDWAQSHPTPRNYKKKQTKTTNSAVSIATGYGLKD